MHPGMYGKSGIAGNVESIIYGPLSTAKGTSPPRRPYFRDQLKAPIEAESCRRALVLRLEN